MSDEPRRDAIHDESFRRVVGKRSRAQPGEPPSRGARDAWAALALHRTGAPKGVFRYRTHEEANRDREAWTLARARTLAGTTEVAAPAGSDGRRST